MPRTYTFSVDPTLGYSIDRLIFGYDAQDYFFSSVFVELEVLQGYRFISS